MALNLPGLKASLQALSETPGNTIAECAQLWAQAITDYAITIVPPSISVVSAGMTMRGEFISAFGSLAAAPLMDIAFTNFAITVGAGMAPTFVAVPPLSPIGFASLFQQPYPASAAAFADKFGNRIDTWMRSGSATPTLGGAPVPWS